MDREILHLFVVFIVAILAIFYMTSSAGFFSTVTKQNDKENVLGRTVFQEINEEQKKSETDKNEKCQYIICETFCFEQDNGDFPYVYGELKAKYPKNTDEDSCTDTCQSESFSDNCIDENNVLEYFCDENNLPATRVRNCRNGCVNGECIPDVCDYEFCFDSDKGDNIFLSGYSEYYKIDWLTGVCYVFRNPEYCIDKEYVVENVCRTSEKRKCPPDYYCENGACVKI